MHSETVKEILGEAVVTDRVINHALRQVANVINRRDLSPKTKIDTVYAYLLKVRREIFNEV